MKIFGINGQLRNKLFLIVIHRFSLLNAAMNAPRICKMCNGVNKPPQFPVRNEYSPQPSKLLYNCQFKTRRRSKTLKGSKWMGRADFSKKTPQCYL